MSKAKLLLALSALILAMLACNLFAPTSPQASPTKVVIVEPTFPPTKSNLPLTEADVPRVSLEEALVAFSSGAAIIVDVRSKQAYDASHIPGALSIELGQIETNPTSLNLPKDQWIITYCT